MIEQWYLPVCSQHLFLVLPTAITQSLVWFSDKQEAKIYSLEVKRGVDLMTSNQIALAQMQETQRSNQARESETHRANLKQEKLARSTLKETKKHNRKTERISRNTLRENRRSNKANEAIGRANAKSNRMNAKTNKANVLLRKFEAITNADLGYKNVDISNRKLQQERELGYAKMHNENKMNKRDNKTRINVADVGLKGSKVQAKAKVKSSKIQSKTQLKVTDKTNASREKIAYKDRKNKRILDKRDRADKRKIALWGLQSNERIADADRNAKYYEVNKNDIHKVVENLNPLKALSNK